MSFTRVSRLMYSRSSPFTIYTFINSPKWDLKPNHSLMPSNKGLHTFATQFLLHQTITKATRVCATASTLIDHIYTNKPERISLSGVISYGISDHYLTFVSLKKNLEKREKISFSCLKLTNHSYESLNNELRYINWYSFYQINEPSLCWDMLYKSYLNTLDRIAPLEVISNVKQADDWVTPELLSLIRQRDKLKEEMNTYTGTIQYSAKAKKFKEKRNQIKRAVINAKRNYALLKISSNADNPRKYWAELNRIMPNGKSKKDKEIIRLNDDLNLPIEEDKISTYINQFFVNIGPTLASKITTDNRAYLDSLGQCVPDKTLSNWIPIEEEELEKIVKELDVNKNSNIDDISTSLLRDCIL